MERNLQTEMQECPMQKFLNHFDLCFYWFFQYENELFLFLAIHLLFIAVSDSSSITEFDF